MQLYYCLVSSKSAIEGSTSVFTFLWYDQKWTTMDYAQINYIREIKNHLHKVIAGALMLSCRIKAHDSLLYHFVAGRVHLQALLGQLKRLLTQIILLSRLYSSKVFGWLLANKRTLLRFYRCSLVNHFSCDLVSTILNKIA